ncbi:MAG: NfeD family protein [Oscillatoriaceae bacterium SKW80]|nr:NfeD family protein [Oscillatoriaceae bacterium SKYG93]MCX8119728.1 NfeD family protein [Oscillatoriaceae bacterium SKW80]MDW8452395.1 NfeD family protein [Oscillatoriaceae cyanobacterium SKYGB_i_bin93]HIK27632.1 NfeD family protein [Oscillatoriaceae cyanobacterium M7585_C2015_266]
MLLKAAVRWLLAERIESFATLSAGNADFTPAILWLIAGSVLCLAEALLPTAFTAFTMGLAALVVSLFAWIFPSYFGWQVVLWMGLSTGGVFLTRRLIPKRKVCALEDSREAETLTEIPPGKVGRVLYEGISWRAKCEANDISIPANQKVFVIRKEGTTLIVIPENIIHS